MTTESCPYCGSEVQGTVTIDPVDGMESTWLRCTGVVPHTWPFEPRLDEVMAFRQRVWIKQQQEVEMVKKEAVAAPRGLVHYWSRINGKVKTDTGLWSPQLTDAEIAAELADLARPVDPRMAQEVRA